jgi:poly-gamma-glutamate synthesis protein (capsule biosynthesis protein)
MKNNHYILYTILFLLIACSFVSTVYYQQKTNLSFGDQAGLASVFSSTFSSLLSDVSAMVSLTSEQRTDQSANVLDSETAQVAEPVQPKVVKKITMLAVGDIMMHQIQIDSAYDKTTDSYDLSEYFKNVNSYLKDGDIVYANLETPVAGKELKYSGYPKFNAPIEILGELKKNYFTHLSLSNNHALDRGAVGLSNTIQNVVDEGMIPLGVREVGTVMTMDNSTSSTINYQITEKNGIKVGFLAYTYDTNGMTLPKNKVGMISYINKEQITKDIGDLKNQNVDIITVALHFGVEYSRVENASQRSLAQLACDNGADIILGDHPHVLQPIVYLNNSTNDKKCLVIYSLSNFISGMPNLYTDLGGILKVDILKNGTQGGAGVASSSISIQPEFFGTWVKRGTNKDGSKYFAVLPLDANKIPEDIEVTKTESGRLETYRKFLNDKILPGMSGVRGL